MHVFPYAWYALQQKLNMWEQVPWKISISKDEKGSSVQIRHGPATVKGESAQPEATDPCGLGRHDADKEP